MNPSDLPVPPLTSKFEKIEKDANEITLDVGRAFRYYLENKSELCVNNLDVIQRTAANLAIQARNLMGLVSK